MKITARAKLCLLFLLLMAAPVLSAEDGYRLWLRYEPVNDNKKLFKDYRTLVTAVVIQGDSPTLRAAKKEIDEGLRGILGRETQFTDGIQMSGAVIIGTPQNSKIIRGLGRKEELRLAGKEGFIIESAWIN